LSIIVTVDPAANFAARDAAELATLAAAARGSEGSASWPGRDLEWVRPEWFVRVRDVAGRLVSVAGILVREGTYDGRTVCIGGVGGVKTHPDSRRRGYATEALTHATEFLRSEGAVAFALLVCSSELLSYYGRRGWCGFGGGLLIRNRQETVAFTIAAVMTRPIQEAAPRDGTIDLCGPPW